MRQRRFLMLWTLAVAAATAAFIVHLALRGKTVDLGYRLGKVPGRIVKAWNRFFGSNTPYSTNENSMGRPVGYLK